MRNSGYSMMMLRRIAVATVASVTALTLAACGSSAAAGNNAQEKGMLDATIGLSVPTLANAGLFVAFDQKLFQKAGVNMKVVQLQSSLSAKQALQAKGADFIITGANSVIEADAQGFSLYDVMDITDSVLELCVSRQFAAAHDLAYGDPPAKVVRAVSSANWAVTSFGDGPDVERQMLFKTYLGSTTASAHVIDLDQLSAEEAAMKQGRIDAIIQGAPTCELMQKEGIGVRVLTDVTVPSLKSLPSANLLTTKQFASAHPELVRRVVSALMQGSEDVRNDPTKAVAVLKKSFPTVPDAILLQSLKQVVIPAMVPSGKAKASEWHQLEVALKDAGVLKGTLPSTAEGVMWTNQFVN